MDQSEIVLRLKCWKDEHPSSKARLPADLQMLVASLTIPGFTTLAEKLYAVFHDLLIRPACHVCGGAVVFRGLFPRTCSITCAARDPERLKKIKCTSQKIYGVDHPSRAKAVQDKTRKTTLERYGVEHTSQAPAVKQKTASTNIGKYGSICTLNSAENIVKKKSTWVQKHGVDNPAKAAGVLAKIKATSFQNYAETKTLRLEELRGLGIKPLFSQWVDSAEVYPWKHVMCGTEFEYHFVGDIIPRCPTCYPKNASLEEHKIRDLLIKLGVDFIANDRKMLGGRELDILIASANLAIEINGVYWHHDLGTTLALAEKTKLAAEKGIQLIHFWDFEVNGKFEIVKNIILAKLKLHQKLHARKLTVSVLTSQEAASFLNSHHLAGFARAKIYLGLKSADGHIVTVASFASNRFKKDGTWELVRFACRDCVVGGLSKLISYFRKIMPGVSLVSFADARISTGDAYTKIGFISEGLTKPNYFYSRGNKRLHRQQAMKHKLPEILSAFDQSLSEYQNMVNNGWIRCFDCGSYKFLLV